MNLQNIEPSTLVVLVMGLALICGVVVILFFGIQIVGSVLGVFGHFFSMLTGVISGGPASWCGCLVLVFGCTLCSVLGFALFQLTQTCAT
ncbi:MAG TPA: hypothetical protein VHL11_21075, partial [Phototrophicaceae bacterium]|nr:hypothetical protein [Phototrophicaceae bacterium]